MSEDETEGNKMLEKDEDEVFKGCKMFSDDGKKPIPMKNDPIGTSYEDFIETSNSNKMSDYSYEAFLSELETEKDKDSIAFDKSQSLDENKFIQLRMKPGLDENTLKIPNDLSNAINFNRTKQQTER